MYLLFICFINRHSRSSDLLYFTVPLLLEKCGWDFAIVALKLNFPCTDIHFFISSFAKSKLKSSYLKHTVHKHLSMII